MIFARFLGLALYPAAAPVLAADPLADVDPFIGTGGEGHTFPGAVAPFGSVQPSPDTDHVVRDSYRWAAGYRHDDPTIEGFSHTRFSGAGHSDLGDILVMPAVGDAAPLEPGDAAKAGLGCGRAHGQGAGGAARFRCARPAAGGESR